jgi:heme/copper-type cytochrome/quinol oxidase subunit 3
MTSIMSSPRSAPTTGKLTNAQVGMFVTMASFAMLFGTLLLSYLLIRARQAVWPPIGVEPMDPFVPRISTAVLLASSWTFHTAIAKLRAQQIERARMLWRVGMMLGAAFMLMQFLVCWNWRMEGVIAGDSLFASIIYTLIGVHFFHALASWASLVWVYFKKKHWTAASETPQMAVWFWHFLDVVWIITFVLIFVG